MTENEIGREIVDAAVHSIVYDRAEDNLLGVSASLREPNKIGHE